MKSLIHLVGPVAAQVSPVVERTLREELAITGQEITDGPAFYGVYPYLFADLVPALDQQILLELGQFCREYATYSIWLDKLMDRQVEPAPRLLLATAKAQQHAVRRLSRLFQVAPALWDSFDRYVAENIAAVIAESELTLEQAPEIALAQYLQLAEGKVGVAKIAATALAVLGGRPELVPDLERMQALQARGMQLADDVQDWREDLRRGRPSYPLTLFFRQRPELLAGARDLPAVLRREILRSSCFAEALDAANEAFAASLAEAERLGCQGWIRLVSLNLQRTAEFRAELARLQARLLHAGDAYAAQAHVADADVLERGVAFLCGAQDPDGCFRDFPMPPGLSDGWMTGYVTLSLAEAGRVVADPRSQRIVQQGARALRRLYRPGGWGFNDRCATDGDSTAFAVRALLAAGSAVPAPAGDLLALYIDADGRGHTFARQEMGEWAGRHADLTPSLGLALQAAGVAADLQARAAAASITDREASGGWTGYWWRQPHYATWLNLEWLRRVGALTPTVARQAVESLDHHTEELTALDLACLVGAHTELAAVTGETLPQALLNELVARQQADGGWPASLSLQLPAQQAGPEADEAPCYADTRRLFTTATALRVLARVRTELPTPQAVEVG